jgi:hypothetical protein
MAADPDAAAQAQLIYKQPTNKGDSMRVTPAGVFWTIGALAGFFTIAWITNNNDEAASTGFGFVATMLIGGTVMVATVFALAFVAAAVMTFVEWAEAKLNGRDR